MSVIEIFGHDPREIDPRPCEGCGLTIDRHVMIDSGDGPELFCADLSPDKMTLDELQRRAELRRQEDVAAILARWELDDPRDRWRHTGEPQPRPAPERRASAEPYRTARATVDAFWHVVRLGDDEHLGAWLDRHPLDAPYLVKLLSSEGK